LGGVRGGVTNDLACFACCCCCPRLSVGGKSTIWHIESKFLNCWFSSVPFRCSRFVRRFQQTIIETLRVLFWCVMPRGSPVTEKCRRRTMTGDRDLYFRDPYRFTVQTRTYPNTLFFSMKKLNKIFLMSFSR
jgi:hypothetical protein